MTNNDRKDIILTAAVRELNLRGYARTTMTQVEMAAADALKPRGCAPEPDGFIYEDFNSKEAIAAEWFARVIKKATERAKEDVIDLGDAQRLRVALEYVMRELLHRLQSRRVFVAGALAFGTPLAPIDPQLYELPREAFIKEMELLFEKLNLLKHVEVRLKELELQPSDFFGVLFFAYGLLVLAWLADRSANFEHTTEAMKHLAGIIAAALYSPGGEDTRERPFSQVEHVLGLFVLLRNSTITAAMRAFMSRNRVEGLYDKLLTGLYGKNPDPEGFAGRV